MEEHSLDFFMDWLDLYLNFERNPKKGIFWLDTMEFFTGLLGHPERAYRCLHVAGSKGKGSVSMMAACILEEAGFKVGLYTSPHITDFRERVALPHSFLPAQIYVDSARQLMELVDSVADDNLPAGRRPTWFELVTLFAMLCFKRAGLDWVVWEVGLGGRLDSTNVVRPECCMITAIELEHTDFLGDTLEKIAGEKAGIIKPGVPVLVAAQQTEGVREVFLKKARECESPIAFCDQVSSPSFLGYCREGEDAGMSVSISSSKFSRSVNTKLRLLGRFQADNAALACLAVKTVLPGIDEGVMERGLSKAVLPGRFELVFPVKGFGNIPVMVLDGAHTPRSVAFTMDSFKSLYGVNAGGTGIKPVLLFACAADKDVEDIAPLFRDSFSTVFLTRPGQAKASDMGRLEKAFAAAGMEYRSDPDYNAAIQDSLIEADLKGLPLLVTGSFYLLAELKKHLL
ncbi:MAG: bifunctional folylpolyglutamate synthase/dihydrofolate synthase [Treponema sp.]|nr:bifunctional folylpolyglutamate synthase/dihydrofolate synthase [Treponema sp.]